MLDREGTITLDTRRQALTHVEAWYGLGRDCGVPSCLRWIRNCRFGNSGDRGCVHRTSAHGKRCAHLHRQEVTHLSFAKSLSARSSGALICLTPSRLPLSAQPSPRPSTPSSAATTMRSDHLFPSPRYRPTCAGVARPLRDLHPRVVQMPATKKKGLTARRETRASASFGSQRGCRTPNLSSLVNPLNLADCQCRWGRRTLGKSAEGCNRDVVGDGLQRLPVRRGKLEVLSRL